MAVYAGTRVIKDGLILQLDAANAKNSILDSVEVLVVAGGGAGSSHNGGGGGAGGVIFQSVPVTAQSYTVTVGAGGANDTDISTPTTATNGGNSTAFGLTAIGGGRGGAWTDVAATAGGSGGGSGCGEPSSLGPAAGTAYQGYPGGASVNGASRASGGGGGAGGPGRPAPTGSLGGAGGPGLYFGDFFGTAFGQTGWFGGGGGGMSRNAAETVSGAGGIGGGGAGRGRGDIQDADSGSPNTGGGGGAKETNGTTGTGLSGSGGSGVVLIRYPGPQRATGGTISRFGDYTIHAFTNTGNSTFTVLPAYANAQEFTAAADFSNSGNIGTAVNGPTYSSSDGGGFVFDGVNDTINIDNIDLRQDFTYECWVLHNAVSGFSFLGQGITSTRSGLHIWFRDASNLRFGMFSNDTDALSLSTSTGVWYHYCFTYNHSTFLKQIYRNSILLTGSPQQAQTSYIGTGIVRIGATFSTAGAYANGIFSSAKIYNRALTAQEIQQNFEATRGRYGL